MRGDSSAAPGRARRVGLWGSGVRYVDQSGVQGLA
jgi:hypothetical protein